MVNDLYDKDNRIKKIIEQSDKIIKNKLKEESIFKDKLWNQIDKNKQDNDELNSYKQKVEIDIDLYKKNIDSLKNENKHLKIDLKNIKDPPIVKE